MAGSRADAANPASAWLVSRASEGEPGMDSIGRRATQMFPSLMLSILSLVQALDLELLWTRSRTIRSREARIRSTPPLVEALGKAARREFWIFA